MTVGDLKIILTASTIGLTTSLRTARASVAQFSTSVRTMGTRIGTGLMTTFRGIGTSITGIFHTVHNVISGLMRKIRIAMLVGVAAFALVTWAGAKLEDALMRTFAVLTRGAEGFEEDLKAEKVVVREKYETPNGWHYLVEPFNTQISFKHFNAETHTDGLRLVEVI